MTSQELIPSIIGLFGIAVGVALKGIIDLFIRQRELTHKKGHEFKEIRYKTLILLMYSMLDFEKEKRQLLKNGRDFKNKEELLDEIKAEWNNMILFASDDVLKSIKVFIKNPIEKEFHIAALAMRKDLYKLNTKLQESDLKI